MSTDCLFCKIIAGEIPSDIVYRDDLVTAFRDINPVAPTHVLIVPNQHLASVNEVQPEHRDVMGHLFLIARQVAEQEGITQSGYRLIVNTGPDAGQVIFHLHMHLIGGHRLRMQMG